MMLAVGPRSTQREYFLDDFSTNQAQLLLCQTCTGVNVPLCRSGWHSRRAFHK